MVSTSKILTVSYGTFSCTLEGFDDSFDTMKAIAEYFRDLAADDRYFGAEPPTPDAEMLARIAEREIARRVEAHEDQGKIHLRAQDADGALAATGLLAPEAETPVEAAPEEDAAPADDVLKETDDIAEEPVEALEPVATDPADVAEADETPETSFEEVVEEEEFAEELSAEEALDEPETSAQDEATPVTEDFDVNETAESVEAKVEEPASEEAEVEEDAPASEPYDLDPDIAAFMADAAAEEAELAAAQHDESVDEAVEVNEIEAEIAELEDIQQDEPLELSDFVADSAVTGTAAEDDPKESETDDIAEKLQRIRAVAAQSETEFPAQDFSEDEHAEDLLEETSSELEALLASTQDDEEDVDATPQLDRAVETLEDAFLDDDEDVAADASQTSETEESSEVLVADAVEAAEADIEPKDETEAIDEDELAQLLADATPEKFADTDVEALASTEASETPVTNFEFADEESGDVVEDVAALEEDPEPLVLGSDDRVEIVEEDFPEILEDDLGDSTLSPEDEADLLRELAEVEAEMSTKADASMEDVIEDAVEVAEAPEEAIDLAEAEEIADAALAMAEQRDALSNAEDMTTASDLDPTPEAEMDLAIEADPEPEKEKPRGLKRLLGMGKNEPEQDVERIFDEADSQMEDKEASLRRNAIQHLRAAVAATRAEHKAGGKIDNDVDESPYRSDLAEVVRPRRPSASETTTASRRPTRPEDIDPAPLKLVAEQRVDVERDPVRPRRVSAGERRSESEMQSDVMGGFATFAEEMGATELPEILEAAAAYMSDIEGRAEFSRPMLMSKLKEVTSDSYSREDGLRSFGELLRGGKLRKIRGGRFAVTDETEFRSEARNAG